MASTACPRWPGRVAPRVLGLAVVTEQERTLRARRWRPPDERPLGPLESAVVLWRSRVRPPRAASALAAGGVALPVVRQ